MAEEKKEVATEEGTPLTKELFEKGLTKLEDIMKSVSTKDEGDEETEDFVEKAVTASDEIKKGVEVSQFLNDMVEEVGEAINGIQKSVTAGQEKLEKAFTDSMEITKSLVEVVKGLAERMDKFETTAPQGRKSVISKGVERSESEEDGGAKVTLSKGQVADQLASWATKNEHGVTIADVTRFENHGTIRKSIHAELLKLGK